jgi:DNA excision repair protein ERCC-4
VSNQSRRLISDLTTLRRCLSYLLSYDCVSFYRYLLTVRTEVTLL